MNKLQEIPRPITRQSDLQSCNHPFVVQAPCIEMYGLWISAVWNVHVIVYGGHISRQTVDRHHRQFVLIHVRYERVVMRIYIVTNDHRDSSRSFDQTWFYAASIIELADPIVWYVSACWIRSFLSQCLTWELILIYVFSRVLYIWRAEDWFGGCLINGCRNKSLISDVQMISRELEVS